MKHLWDYQVKQELPVREWLPTDLQTRQYAEATGDYNPIHLDEAVARRLGLDGTVVQGMLAMAQLGALLTEWIGEDGMVESFKARMEKTIRTGERIVLSGYIKDVCANAVICCLTGTDDGGRKALTGEAVVTFRKGKTERPADKTNMRK